MTYILTRANSKLNIDQLPVYFKGGHTKGNGLILLQSICLFEMLSIFQKPIKNGRCIKRSPRNERKKLYPIHMKNGKELNVNWICETRWNEIKIWNFLFYRNEGMVQMGWLNAFAKHRLSNTFSANSRHFTFPPDLRVLFEIQCHVPPWQLVFTPFLFLSPFLCVYEKQIRTPFDAYACLFAQKVANVSQRNGKKVEHWIVNGNKNKVTKQTIFISKSIECK